MTPQKVFCCAVLLGGCAVAYGGAAANLPLLSNLGAVIALAAFGLSCLGTVNNSEEGKKK